PSGPADADPGPCGNADRVDGVRTTDRGGGNLPSRPRARRDCPPFRGGRGGSGRRRAAGPRARRDAPRGDYPCRACTQLDDVRPLLAAGIWWLDLLLELVVRVVAGLVA